MTTERSVIGVFSRSGHWQCQDVINCATSTSNLSIT
jgi:hypothetical protein